MTQRITVKHGCASVSYGQPFYGKTRIVANAPLSRNAFDDLIAALTQARDSYIAQSRSIPQRDKAERCPGFQWIGQSLRYCDGCGQPFWEHDYLQVLNRDKVTSPFADDDTCWKYEPISDGDKAAARSRWANS